MTTALAPLSTREPSARPSSQATTTFVVSILGFFIAVVVNVALPTIRTRLGGGITGLQWVVDGYTLMFAALLLTAGSISDRIGARRAFGLGLGGLLIASLACGLAPNLAVLVVARFVQGSAAALMMPTSMALVRHAYTDPAHRARAVAIWAMGGSLAASSGPILGGLLTVVSWRLIFLINLPVGLLALVLLKRCATSPERTAPIDWYGQVSAVLAMGGLTYGAIGAGTAGWTAARVLLAFVVAAVGIAAFLVSQQRVRQPMVPPSLLKHRTVDISLVIGFAFMVIYYGLPFVLSLYFQQQRGLSALATGVVFLPMMLIGTALTPFVARAVEHVGHRVLVVGGLATSALGAVLLALMPASTPIGALSVLMILVGLGGPTITPPTTAVLLNSVHGHLAGTASGVFNTSRQVGGALAVAVFGGLLASGDFITGMRSSLLIAAAVAIVAALAATRLHVTPIRAT